MTDEQAAQEEADRLSGMEWNPNIAEAGGEGSSGSQARFTLDDGREVRGELTREGDPDEPPRFVLEAAAGAGLGAVTALEVLGPDTAAFRLPDGGLGPPVRGHWEMPPGFTFRPRPRPRAARQGVSHALTFAVAALAAAGAVVGGSVAAATKASSRVASSPLAAPCPAPATPAPPADQSGVGCNAYVVQRNGDVRQTVDVTTPTSIPVSFGFCSGFTCGDADPECLANQFIPGFGAGAVVRSVQLVPPAGAHLKDVVAGEGPALPRVRAVAATPNTNPDGSVSVNVPSELMSHFRTHLGRVCGLGDAAHTDFVNKYGTAFDNSAGALIRVVVTWTGATQPTSGPGGPVTISGSASGPEAGG
jgi:hypothetical protein